MKATSIDIAMTIISDEKTFSSEASMLRWMSDCLNCNRHHASVTIEKFNRPKLVMQNLSRISRAFESVNNLLDASVVSDNEQLLHAVHFLRLSIARAEGDDIRVKSAESALQALNPVISDFDLWTYDGWIAAAKALLSEKPVGTALDDMNFDDYLVLIDGSLLSIPKGATLDNNVAIQQGLPVDATQVDISAWSDVTNSWDNTYSVYSRDVLLMPKFVNLKFHELKQDNLVI